MTKNKNIILIAVALIIVIVGGLYLYSVSTQPKIKSLTINNSEFIIAGRGLSKVEIWGVVAGANPSAADNMLLTIAQAPSGSTGDQKLTAHVPLRSFSLSQIFAIGYDKNGKNIGKVNLIYPGTNLKEAVWGTTTEFKTK